MQVPTYIFKYEINTYLKNIYYKNKLDLNIYKIYYN